MTREQAIREIACDLKIRAQVIALQRLAQETAEIYDELIRCKTPPELVRGYFLVSMLRERIDEETARRTAPVSRIEIIHSNADAET